MCTEVCQTWVSWDWVALCVKEYYWWCFSRSIDSAAGTSAASSSRFTAMLSVDVIISIPAQWTWKHLVSLSGCRNIDWYLNLCALKLNSYQEIQVLYCIALLKSDSPVSWIYLAIWNFEREFPVPGTNSKAHQKEVYAVRSYLVIVINCFLWSNTLQVFKTPFKPWSLILMVRPEYSINLESTQDSQWDACTVSCVMKHSHLSQDCTPF